MKSINHFSTAKDKLLHIETDGAVVNIRVGLTNMAGKRVTSIEILADNDMDDKWVLDGTVNNRLIKEAD